MRVVKTLGVGMAAALLLWAPSVAMAATGRWIKTGPGGAGIYQSASGYEEYMPSTAQAKNDLVDGWLGGGSSAPRAPMNAAQKKTAARIARDLHRAFEAIGL